MSNSLQLLNQDYPRDACFTIFPSFYAPMASCLDKLSIYLVNWVDALDICFRASFTRESEPGLESAGRSRSHTFQHTFPKTIQLNCWCPSLVLTFKVCPIKLGAPWHQPLISGKDRYFPREYGMNHSSERLPCIIHLVKFINIGLFQPVATYC